MRVVLISALLLSACAPTVETKLPEEHKSPRDLECLSLSKNTGQICHATLWNRECILYRELHPKTRTGVGGITCDWSKSYAVPPKS